MLDTSEWLEVPTKGMGQRYICFRLRDLVRFGLTRDGHGVAAYMLVRDNGVENISEETYEQLKAIVLGLPPKPLAPTDEPLSPS